MHHEKKVVWEKWSDPYAAEDTHYKFEDLELKSTEEVAEFEELEEEFDVEKRHALAKQFHKLIYDEQPYTFFYTRQSKYFWNKELENVKAQLTRPYLNARAWYIKGE